MYRAWSPELTEIRLPFGPSLWDYLKCMYADALQGQRLWIPMEEYRWWVMHVRYQKDFGGRGW